MKSLPPLALCAVFALSLAGCSDATKKTFGLESTPPDAFQVGIEAPLSLPPELSVLPPPNPGQPRPQQVDAAQAGANVLDPANAITPPSRDLTPGAQALLQQAGPTPPAGIRAQINQNALVASKPAGFVSQVLGTAPSPQPLVDPSAEQKRIEENEALGKPVTNGSTPQSTPDNAGFFSKILNIF